VLNRLKPLPPLRGLGRRHRPLLLCAAMKLHVRRVTSSVVARFAVAVGPFLNAQKPAFDVNRPAAAQILRRGFRLPSPQSDPKPGTMSLFSPVVIFPAFVRGQTEAADGCACGV